MEIKELTRISLQPGEVLAISLVDKGSPYSSAELSSAKEEAERVLPGIRLIVLDPGIKLEAIKA